MSAAWTTVIIVGIGTVLLKAVGPVAVSGRRLHPRVTALLELVAPAILAALVITEAFGSGRSLVLDARVAGLAVGVVGVRLRAPFWLIVLAGALATALVRLVTPW